MGDPPRTAAKPRSRSWIALMSNRPAEQCGYRHWHHFIARTDMIVAAGGGERDLEIARGPLTHSLSSQLFAFPQLRGESARKPLLPAFQLRPRLPPSALPVKRHAAAPPWYVP